MTTKEREIVDVMDAMPYGLYIVGSTGESGPNGMMADWLSQVSFRPRLLCVAIENDATTLANIRANAFFTVNFLPENATGFAVARQFAAPYLTSKVRPKSDGVRPKLEHVGHRLTERGCPVLASALAWLECEAVNLVPAGDHTLVVGQVTAGRYQAEGAPLTSAYTGWTYSG